MLQSRDRLLRARNDGNECVRCAKAFKLGDRIQQILIFEERVDNPFEIDVARRQGVHLSQDFEFAHIACHDPQLKKGINHG